MLFTAKRAQHKKLVHDVSINTEVREVLSRIEEACSSRKSIIYDSVLQDATIWAEFIENLVIPHNNASELYFEENNIEEFAQKLDDSPYDIEYVNRLMTHSWGQKVIRFYDPDGNLIEVGTP